MNVFCGRAKGISALLLFSYLCFAQTPKYIWSNINAFNLSATEGNSGKLQKKHGMNSNVL